MKALICKLIMSCSLAAPNAKPVEDLSYGTLLYAYFQEDYQQAMLEGMVADAQQQRGDNPVRFQLAEGSFAFNAGMYGYASEIFSAVDPAELEEIDKLRLAFHSAREFHRRLDWPSLETELAKIDLGKSWRGRGYHHPEVEYMRAELAIHKGDMVNAREHLDRLEETNPLRAYGLYNLGVALKERGADIPAAERVFAELGAMDAYSDEALDLIQRAKLAQAFLARDTKEQQTAVAVLRDMPGGGRYRDTALAAYAGLAMDQGDHELAARIWLTLKDQEYWTPSTAAARMGFPMTLESLESRRLALQHYRAAENVFAQRLVTLDGLADRANDPHWVRGLLQAFATPLGQDDVAADHMQQWQEELGHTDWLQWLSSEAVHGVLVQWRDLVAEQQWLETLPEELDAFAQVAVEQKRRGAAAASLLHDEHLLSQRHALAIRLADSQVKIQELARSQPVFTSSWVNELANDEERELLTKLDRMEQAFSAAAVQDKKYNKRLRRVRKLQGLMFFEVASTQSKRVRGLEKQAGEIATVLRDINERIARVEVAEGEFEESVAADFSQFNHRSSTLMTRVSQAIGEREQILAAELRRGMRREQRQVQQYLVAARVAVARTSDQLAGVEIPR